MTIRDFIRFTFFAAITAISISPLPTLADNYTLAKGSSTGSHVFPEPPELRDAVQFWRQVFGVWHRNQIVLHDNEYLGAIYEVIPLPPPWSEGLTTDQKHLIESRRASLERRLNALETGLRLGLALNPEQRRLHDIIVKAGGKFAVFGASERVRHQRGMQERFLEGLQTSGRYMNHIREVFRNARLPEDLGYLPHIESSFMNHSRSHVGAAGIWQFMRSTGVHYLTINDAVDERFDPVFAARGAARYLGGAYQRLGDWGLAVTSYNHGINGMAVARDHYGTDIGKIVRYYKGRLFGFASRNFYAEFLAVRSIINNLNKYFPGGVRFERPIDHARVRLMYPAPLPQLANFYGIRPGIVQYINPALTSHAASGRTPIPAGTELWLPKHAVPDPTALTVYTRRQESFPLETRAYSAPRTAAPPKHTVSSTASAKPIRKKDSTRHKTHVVRKGESAFRIATRYGVRLGAMMALNDLNPDAVIRPGQKLRIPAK